MILSILGSVGMIFSHSYAYLQSLVVSYGYLAIFGLMLLESSSLPVPSEVVMPLAGLFAARGLLSFPIAFLVALLGSAVGMAIDFYVGYFVGKEVVYRHLHLFHVKRETLDSFDRWFAKNGEATVFLTKLVPIIRTLISFPAGFARMDQKKFLVYSITGAAIWNFVLMLFGFYFLSLSSSNVVAVMSGVGILALAMYIIYRAFSRRIGK